MLRVVFCLLVSFPVLAVDAGEVQRGNELYHRSCTMCHGMNGTVGDRAPALAGARRFLRNRPEDLFDAIKHGIPGTLMPPTSMPDADVHAIVAYIRSLRATAFENPTPGDPAQGEKIFFGKAKCGDCHTVRGRGGILGPELTNTAAERSLAFLKDALTKPRPHPTRGYQSARVETVDGKKLSGVIKNENNFSVQLLDTNSQLHLLTRDEIRTMEHARESLMPSDYDKTLTEAEFRDLLAYLTRLGRPGAPSGRRSSR
jgi:putative heme-binding domain-containing protein